MTEAAAILRARTGEAPVRTALVLGTGLGGIAAGFAEPAAVPFAELPGFPAGAVTGHAKRVVIGRFGGKRVAALEGRAHYYEAGNAAAMRVPIETLAALGVRTLVLTNAAGSLRTDMPPGHLMLIGDHINMTSLSPLVGEAGDERFVSMIDAYDPALRRLATQVAARRVVPLAEGVYMWFPGPELRDARGDPRRARPGCRCGGHVDGARDDHCAPLRPARGRVLGHDQFRSGSDGGRADARRGQGRRRHRGGGVDEPARGPGRGAR